MANKYYNGVLSIVDSSGNVNILYPKTKASNVVMNDGSNLEDKINTLNSAVTTGDLFLNTIKVSTFDNRNIITFGRTAAYMDMVSPCPSSIDEYTTDKQLGLYFKGTSPYAFLVLFRISPRTSGGIMSWAGLVTAYSVNNKNIKITTITFGKEFILYYGNNMKTNVDFTVKTTMSSDWIIDFQIQVPGASDLSTMDSCWHYCFDSSGIAIPL